MEIFLEQFIPSDKDKRMLKKSKIASIIVIAAGVVLFFTVSPLLAVILQIAAVLFFVVSYFSFIDYEYELFNGNIDISKIYAGSIRKAVQRINKEDVEAVYQFTGRTNRGQSFFNSNVDNLNVYSFKLRNGNQVQLALNEEMENIIKIIYRGKIEIQ